MPDDGQTAATATLPVYDNAQAWRGPALKLSNDWIYRLGSEDIIELRTAADAVRASGRTLTETSRSDFPLPRLTPTLQRIRDEVLRGRGIFLLRGLPVDQLSPEQTEFCRLDVQVGLLQSHKNA